MILLCAVCLFQVLKVLFVPIHTLYSETPPKGHSLMRTYFSGPMVSVFERFHYSCSCHQIHKIAAEPSDVIKWLAGIHVSASNLFYR